MKLMIKFTGFAGRVNTTRVRTVFAEAPENAASEVYWALIQDAIDRWCTDNYGERRGLWLTVEEID